MLDYWEMPTSVHFQMIWGRSWHAFESKLDLNLMVIGWVNDIYRLKCYFNRLNYSVTQVFLSPTLHFTSVIQLLSKSCFCVPHFHMPPSIIQHNFSVFFHVVLTWYAQKQSIGSCTFYISIFNGKINVLNGMWLRGTQIQNL